MVDPQPCGTYGAFQRHKKRGEPVDEACREARNAYMREARRRNPDTLRGQLRQARLRKQACAILIKRHHQEYLVILTELKESQP